MAFPFESCIVRERHHFLIPTCELICLLSINHQTFREKSPVWETLCHTLNVLLCESEQPAEAWAVFALVNSSICYAKNEAAVLSIKYFASSVLLIVV